MGSSFGKNINVSIFGQSHSASIGVVDFNGHRIDLEKPAIYVKATGRNEYSTQRSEAHPVILRPRTVLCCPFAELSKTPCSITNYSEVQTNRVGHADSAR